MFSVRLMHIAPGNQMPLWLRTRKDNTSLAAARGLIMKRRAFMFEHEVRMLWIDRQTPRFEDLSFMFCSVQTDTGNRSSLTSEF